MSSGISQSLHKEKSPLALFWTIKHLDWSFLKCLKLWASLLLEQAQPSESLLQSPCVLEASWPPRRAGQLQVNIWELECRYSAKLTSCLNCSCTRVLVSMSCYWHTCQYIWHIECCYRKYTKWVFNPYSANNYTEDTWSQSRSCCIGCICICFKDYQTPCGCSLDDHVICSASLEAGSVLCP